LRIGAQRNERFADGLGATLAEAAIVLRRSTFVGETGDDDLSVVLLQEAGDLLDFPFSEVRIVWLSKSK
jgi:hypothetical protein